MRVAIPVVAMCLAAAALTRVQAPPPQVVLSNGPLNVLLYLPDATNGFFRGTRFDWSGIVGRLEFAHHVVYDRWFSRVDPATRDWTANADVVAGPNTAMTGPAEEFEPLGYETAPAGGAFVKIGVGLLAKPVDAAPYNSMRLYDIRDPGARTLALTPTTATFTHALTDSTTGYGYAYTKVIRLAAGLPVMTIEHRLTNTGRERIDTSVYNHNFLALDGLTTGPGFVVRAPYAIESTRPPNPALASVAGREVIYLSELTGSQTVATPLSGFGTTAADYDFRVEHTKAGIGVRITGDRPLSNAVLWSMRTTLAVEPFVRIAVAPGEAFTWTLTYTYYQLAK